MTRTLMRRAAIRLAVILSVSALAGCGALDVSDPTAIEESELENASGAALMRDYAMRNLYNAVSQSALLAAIFTDEYLVDPDPYYQDFNILTDVQVLDQRESLVYEHFSNGYSTTPPFQALVETRRAASFAIPKLRTFGGAAGQARAGQMYAVRGFATLRIAEDFCPGFPLHEVEGQTLKYGGPLTNVQAFERALADFDSAMVDAVDSTEIMNFVHVGRARTLLALGRFAEAATDASAVPTPYVLRADFQGPYGFDVNQMTIGGDFTLSRSVADNEGGTGLDFVSADDPRLQTDSVGNAYDGVAVIYAAAKYADKDAPVVVADGIEARLIEAEADLREGGSAWLTILNDLRNDHIPALSSLADPGTVDGRVDLLFRERAFWLFGTGHRLGDLRRLLAYYGRDPETVFPTGGYRLGGTYGTGTSIPFDARSETPYNPAITGCTSY